MMRRFVRTKGTKGSTILIFGFAALACGSDPAVSGGNGTPDAGDAASSDGPGPVPPPDSRGNGDTGPSGDAAPDDGPPDPCGTALFCEKFDTYAGVTAIADKQMFGPWSAALKTGSTMALDGAHTTSGSNALHVHIDTAVTAGGRLFADSAQPIFATKPTHLYGRMMMYINPNGTSIHWTFFGVDGPADPSSPAAGRSASYIMSSLPKNGVNAYSFVYGLSSTPTDGYHDCYDQGATTMPSAFACVSFEMDSVARKLRMYKDSAATPILSVDDHGQGCVAPTPGASPWYGPTVTQLFVGAWSFHAMNAPLDVWIDDLVVDTKPIACP